jgi:protein-disulfide isomerase
MLSARPLAVAAFLTLALSGLAGAVAADEKALTQQEIEKIVRDYLLREPEVLAEALGRLQQRKAAAAAIKAKQAVHDHQQALFSDPTSPVEGNAQGTIAIVEFFDYRCVHCRHVAATLDRLVSGNASVRVIYKNFPVLGEPSVLAARAAVAAQQQGGWAKLHRAMLAFQGDFTVENILTIGKSVGLDAARLKTDMMSPATQKTVRENMTLAAALGLDATPSFVIGDRVIRGALSPEALQAIIDEEGRKQ